MKKVLAMLVVVTLGCGLLAGCGGNTSAPASNTAQDAEEPAEETAEEPAAEEAAEGEAADAGATDVYAVVLKTQSSQFWQDMKAGIEAEAERLGVTVDIQSGNTEDDVEGQVQILENFISTGKYKAIGVAPISDVNLNNAIADATSKGIVVVDVDEKIDADALAALGGGLYGYVATDNVNVGKMGAEELLKQVGSNEIEVAIVEGKAGALSGEQRRDGAREAFEAAGATIVDSLPADWDRTKAMDVATNMINAHPDLAAIYCCNDTMAMGVQEAVAASGKDIKVCGTDGNADAIQSVADGNLAATVAQDPAAIGARALQLMVEAVNAGATVEAGQSFETYGIDAVLINAENANDYL